MRFWLLAAIAFAFGGCDAAIQYDCTDVFQTVAVEVVDAAGRPVVGLETRSVLERTGDVLQGASDYESHADGIYIVASDADLDVLSIGGDRVLFTATGDAASAQATFVLADDGCHITREEGPAQITAEAL